MKKKVLFVITVNPFDAKKYYFPPLGLAYLVSSLKKAFKDEEFEFKIVTENFEKELKIFSPALVGISSMTQNYNIAVKYAKDAKDRGCKVIVGGVHISTLPESLTEDMDIGVIGEGEQTIIELMKIYLQNNDFPSSQLNNIKGIVFRENGQIKITERRESIYPADNISHPERSLTDDRENCLIFSSRGCFYNCIYCPSLAFWGKPRFFSADYIVEEIREITGRGIKFINFADYLLASDKERMKKIIEQLKEEKILGKCYFSISTISSLIDEEVAKLLKEMNIVSVSMSLVSGVDEILKSLKVPHSVKINKEAIKILKKNNISIYTSFNIGLPDETKENIRETLKFIKENSLKNFDVYLPTPYPQTLFWDMAKGRKIVEEKMDWDKLNCDFSNNYKKIVIISKDLKKEELYKLFLEFQKYKKFLPFKDFLSKVINYIRKFLPHFL